MALSSIRARMTFAFALTISLVMFLACGGLIWYARRAAERRADASLAATLAKVRTDLADNAPRIDPADMQEDARLGAIAVWIGGPGGRILFQSQRGGPLTRSGADWRVLVREDGARTIVLSLPWRETRQALSRQAALLVLLGLFVTTTATLGAWIVVGRTLSPISALAYQAQKASAERLRVTLTPPSRDAEIVRLVTTLNALLARLASTAAAKERFHAAVSHELRTPLQVLSGRLELALTRDRSPEEYRECIVEAGVYAQRLSALARDLLLLHHLDGTRLPEKARVNLGDVCLRVLDGSQEESQRCGLRLQMNAAPDAWVETAPSHAEMLVRNLLENAVKYARAGSCVTVDLSVREGWAQLTVENEAALTPGEDPRHWLEPFHGRGAGHRIGAEGTGLGLAICRAISDANGWSLDLRADGGRVRVRADLGPRLS